MDLSRLLPPGWPRSARPATLPEALLAAAGQRGRDAGADRRLRAAAALAARQPPARRGRAASACDFLINGASLKALTEPARALLDGLPPGGPRLAALAAHLAADCPDAAGRPRGAGALRHRLPPPLPARRRHRLRDRRRAARRRAPASRSGPASEEARALRATPRRRSPAPAPSSRFLRDVLDRAPVLAWSHGPDGQVAWANAAYRDRFDAAGGRPARPPHRRRLRPRARGGAADRPRRRQPPPGRGARPRRRRAALVRAQPRAPAPPARPSASRSTPTTSSPPRRRSAASSRR